MSADRGEQHGPENVAQVEHARHLTPTQQAAKEAILDTLLAKDKQRLLIVLEGFSGVGKSLVVEFAGGQVEESGGQIAPTRDIEPVSKLPKMTLTD